MLSGFMDCDYFKSSIEAPKLICKTLPLDKTNAGTDFTPASSAFFTFSLSSLNELH